jgi:hypothetical protein
VASGGLETCKNLCKLHTETPEIVELYILYIYIYIYKNATGGAHPYIVPI